MYEKSCRCGKSKANFKIDIGPFFINDCCTEAGYDEQGNLPQKELTDEEKALAAAAASSPDADNLTVNDDPSLDADASEPTQATTESNAVLVASVELKDGETIEGVEDKIVTEILKDLPEYAAPVETKKTKRNKNS